MSIAVEDVKAALSKIVDPNTTKDYVSGKSVKNLKVDGSDVSLDIELGYPANSQIDGIRSSVIAGLKPCRASATSASACTARSSRTRCSAA
jgi:ATP-binding protein involved in chromosome partitioning